MTDEKTHQKKDEKLPPPALSGAPESSLQVDAHAFFSKIERSRARPRWT